MTDEKESSQNENDNQSTYYDTKQQFSEYLSNLFKSILDPETPSDLPGREFRVTFQLTNIR